MGGEKSVKRWLKAELHTHCNLDPSDYRVCSYSPQQLIAEAARLKYDVLAITCHNQDVWSRELAEYAESFGITLLPGMEVTTEGRKHTLVYNFRTAAPNLDTLAKIRSRSGPDTLVIAPHPFYPARTCLGGLLSGNLDVFDAIEHSGFYTRRLDFNRQATQLAFQSRKPLVGNGDVHLLWQLGRTFSWIYAEPEAGSIIRAVKAGQVRVESKPLSPSEVTHWWATVLWHSLIPTPFFTRPESVQSVAGD